MVGKESVWDIEFARAQLRATEDIPFGGRTRTGSDDVAAPAYRDGIHLPIRWIVPGIGIPSPGARTIQTTASYGEQRQLIKEVSEVCHAFHPTTRLHTFPRDMPIYLFWQAHSTRDWIVARVAATQNAGESGGLLDYYCLVFDDRTFHALRYNPFRTRSLNLHDSLRSHLEEKRTDPFRCTIPRHSAPASKPISEDANYGGRARVIPGLSADRLPSNANLRAIQEFCCRWTEDPAPPPAFATWWGNDAAEVPACFDIVLHRREPLVSTLKEAEKVFLQMAAELNDVSSRVCPIGDGVAVDLVRLIHDDAGFVAEAILRAVASFRAGLLYRLQSDIPEAILQLEQIGTLLDSLAHHVEGRRSTSDIVALARLRERVDDMAYSLDEILQHGVSEPAPGRSAVWPFPRTSGQQPPKPGSLSATGRRPLWHSVLQMLADQSAS